MVRITVLGPMRAEVNGAAVDLGGPRQRGVLALLLAHRGSVVPVDRMIEDLWRGEAPARAIASLQAYVSNLRRGLEPDRPARAPSRVLVSSPPGYAVRSDHASVDAWEFERRLSQARRTGRTAEALELLDTALALWRGPAYAEFADEEWAVAEAARLHELHLAARTRYAELTLRAGVTPLASGSVAAPLAEELTRQHPLHEEGWRLLALALWGSGRQADALAALRRARATLADELGLDPGPALVDLEQAILAQRMEVLRAATAGDQTDRAANPSTVDVTVVTPTTRPPGDTVDGTVFVGRTAELAAIRTAATAARSGGGVVLVSGEAGSGKSHLLRRAGEELRELGWRVVVGRSPETEGAPPAWAWTEALRSLAAQVPPRTHATTVAPLLGESPMTVHWGQERGDPTAGRFHLHRAVCAWLAEAGASTPTAVLLDDVHVADAETLRLLATAATELSGHPILLLAAYRPAEVGGDLEETLATLARRSPTRIALGGLAVPDVAALVVAICGATVDGETVAALADRTGGNPFYVSESARLLASEGALVATSEVPDGVRDVLRRRLARLPESAVGVLRLAAVVGRESDVDLLARACDTDEGVVLDALDAGLIAGLLTEPGPGRVRFVHALVRDTLYTDQSQARRARAHARVARELEGLNPADLAGLAHHYAEAASPATARLAVSYAVRAAEAAELRYATVACAALLRQALTSLALAADATDDERVELMGRLMRAEIRAGQVGPARRTRDLAVTIAERSGRSDLMLAAYAGWTEPTLWHVRPYGTVDERVVGHLTDLLRRDDLTTAVRCGLVAALVAELDGMDDPRMVGLVDEAAALAQASGDPWLVGLAVVSRCKDASTAVDPTTWREMAAQLDELCSAHDLPPYEWWRDYLRAKAAAVTNDVAAFERHVDSAIELAQRYGMPEALSIMAVARAMHAQVGGDFALARQRYLDATQAMTRHGALNADEFLTFALLAVSLDEGHDVASMQPAAQALFAKFGPLAADICALLLARAGDLAEASQLYRLALKPRRDYFWVPFTVLRAQSLLALGMGGLGTDEILLEAEELYGALRPHEEEIAGIGGIAVVLGPVAQVLGDLALLLGRADEARTQYERAARVARRWGARHWVDRALDRFGAVSPDRPLNVAAG